jgi:hypothetical protein
MACLPNTIASMETRTGQLQIRVTPSEKEALRGAARRAGVGMSEWVLRCALPDHSLRLAELAARLDGGSRPAVWAEIIGCLQGLESWTFGDAVAGLETDAMTARDGNYITALVEHRAEQLGVEAPAWTRDVEPLAVPWFGTSLRGLRLHLMVASPVAFRRRNLFVDAGVGDRV